MLVKLHRAQDELQLVGDNLVAKIKQLLDEIPWFHNSQPNYFQPCFESLILVQMVHCSEMFKICGDLTQQLDQPGYPVGKGE